MTGTDQCHICQSLEAPESGPTRPIWEDDLWLVRHTGKPYALPGWTTLYSKRHVAGVAHFNDEEAATFGPTLRRLELALEEVTGALRIYTAAMGESAPHFHAHMVPKLAKMQVTCRGGTCLTFSGGLAWESSPIDEDDVIGTVDALEKRLAE